MRSYQIPQQLVKIVFVEEPTTVEELQPYVDEIQVRLKLFRQVPVLNVIDYNQKVSNPLGHVLFIIMDAQKVKEELYPLLLTLASQGRPVGFFPFLGTQEGIPPALRILNSHAEHFASKRVF